MTRGEAEAFARSKVADTEKMPDKMSKVGLGYVYELIRKIYEESENPKTCYDCRFFTAFDGFCKSPNTHSKETAYLITYKGCNWVEVEE